MRCSGKQQSENVKSEKVRKYHRESGEEFSLTQEEFSNVVEIFAFLGGIRDRRPVGDGLELEKDLNIINEELLKKVG